MNQFYISNAKFLLLMVLIMAGSLLSLSARDGQKTVNSVATEVKVFFNGAQVMRTGEFNLDKGVSILIFEGLSQHINPATISVNGIGNFTILDVNHSINYLRVQEKSPEVKLLEDSLKILQDKAEFEMGMLWVAKEEESLFLANKDIGGTQTGVRATDIKEAADLFRTRLKEIKIKQIELGRKIKLLEESILRIRNQLDILHGITTQPTSEISVRVTSPAQSTGAIELNYYTEGAGWIPIYDLRAKSINEPVELVSKANVFQNTGETWDNVKLSVSSANPIQSGVSPILHPWHLGFYEPPGIELRQNKFASEDINIRGNVSALNEEAVNALGMADFTTVIETQTSFEFLIALPYTLPSDNQKHIVELQKIKFPVEFEYLCIPKIGSEAFLISKITGWENHNLLPGEIQLFFDDTFVGNSMLLPDVTNDTLHISLGRDKGISVKRTRLPEFTERRFLGQNREDSRGWEIVARNNKSEPVKLVVKDQIPVSTNKDIEVSVNETSGANLNKETGILTWRFELKPSESNTLRTSYTVKYPRNKTVILE